MQTPTKVLDMLNVRLIQWDRAITVLEDSAGPNLMLSLLVDRAAEHNHVGVGAIYPDGRTLSYAIKPAYLEHRPALEALNAIQQRLLVDPTVLYVCRVLRGTLKASDMVPHETPALVCSVHMAGSHFLTKVYPFHYSAVGKVVLSGECYTLAAGVQDPFEVKLSLVSL